MPYGTGLDTAFNQDEPQQNINTHPKKVKTPEGLRKVKDGALPDASASHPDDRCSDERVNSFSSNAATTRLRGMGDVLTHPKGYTGKLSDLGDAADVSRKKKSVDYDKIQHLKVGEMVAYTKGQGTIVRKDGAYVTIFNEDAGAYDQVHAGETYIPGDTISMGIMNQLWDQMNYETRMASLHKAEVQEPLHFVDRKWNELPSNLKDVIKAKAGKLPAKRNLNDIGLKDNDPQSETSNSFAENATRTRMSYPKETKDYDKIEDLGNPKMAKSENIQKKSPTYTSYGTGFKKRPTSVGGEKQQERSAYNPGQGYAGGSGTSRTFTPGGKKTKPKENLGPESKRKPAGEGAGPAAEAAAARSTGSTKPKKETYTSYGYGVKDVPAGAKQDVKPSKQKPAKQTSKPKEDGGVTFASGLDKATSYGELATEIYKLRNQLNKQLLGGKEDPFDTSLIDKYTGSKIPGEKLGDLPQGKNRLKPAIGGTKIETHEGEKELKSPADRYKSDVEHGAYGGVVTDTPFDAEGDYEEDHREGDRKQDRHNHQQKTPRDPKEEGDEVLVGYYTKEGGTMSTGTPGANNPTYDEEKERSVTNKNNTRYGIRKASKEDIERLTK